MINKFTMAVYNHAPVCVQNAMCGWAGRRYIKIRYGGEFDKWAAFYAESSKWSAAQLMEYQREQVGLLIRECFDSVPYYSERWKQAGLSPDDFHDLPDLAKFPYTQKEDLFRESERMLSTQYDRRSLIKGMTGGSTGMPLVRYMTKGECQRHYAIVWDRMRQGVSRGDRYAAFQGKEIVPASQDKPPFWRENRPCNQRLYSMRHLSPEKLRFYAESLMEEPFVYYQGYVSFMSVVAEYMAERGLVPSPAPKAVFCTSEQLTTSCRRLFETAWKTRVWNEYGQGERCALIQECPEGNHHVQMDYGVVEFEPVAREGEYLLAEIICTSFILHAAPLVRYRIGDRVVIDETAVCPCGRPGPVIKAIRGRIGEYILTPDGRKYPHISLIVDMLRNVRRVQVVQERQDEIIVRVVPFGDYSDKDEQYAARCFQERIGGGIMVRMERVQDLERLPNGKVLSVINRIPGHSRNHLCGPED